MSFWCGLLHADEYFGCDCCWWYSRLLWSMVRWMVFSVMRRWYVGHVMDTEKMLMLRRHILSTSSFAFENYQSTVWWKILTSNLIVWSMRRIVYVSFIMMWYNVPRLCTFVACIDFSGLKPFHPAAASWFQTGHTIRRSSVCAVCIQFLSWKVSLHWLGKEGY